MASDTPRLSDVDLHGEKINLSYVALCLGRSSAHDVPHLSGSTSSYTEGMMPPAARATKKAATVADATPVEALLRINEQILTTKTNLAQQILLRRLASWALVVSPLGLLALVFVTKYTWRVVDMAFYNLFVGPLLAAAGAIGLAFFVQMTDQSRPAALKLKLALLLDRKQKQSADALLDARYRRSSYRDDIPEAIGNLRRESKFYRRVHNLLQGVIIVGSLATSTVTGLSISGGEYRVLAVITSFSVGIAAGFTGYFKFRERGYYLQQTADSIEQEYQAVELGIGRYKGMSVDAALIEFVAEVERLRGEQQKRAQNLDQPSEKATVPGSG